MDAKVIQILLVEDNPGDIDLTREGVSGWRILNNLNIVRDGAEALAFLRKEGKYKDAPRPDLILLDLNLPKKDGREVLHEIKGDQFLKSIPVVILSSSHADIDILKTYGMGANCYVVKPIGIETFFKVLNSIGDFWFSIVSLPSKELVSQVRQEFKPELSALERFAKSKSQINVLIIDDNPADSFYIEQCLAELKAPSFHVEARQNLASGLERLEANSVDVVILDLGLPESQGLETYQKVVDQFPKLPIVISTGLDDNEIAIKAIRAGAQDYILKNQIEGRLLSRVMQYAIERKWLEEQQNILIAREQAARKEAENATLARDEFLSVASHELKTPITALRLQSQILLQLMNEGSEKELFEKNKRLAKIFNNQTERLVKLIDNLLDISRINAGKLILDFVNVNLNDVVADIIERFNEQLNAAGCRVSLTTDEKAIGHWDQFRIEQVVTNLLTNAMKYGSGKPIDIHIKRIGDFVELKVSDSGIGIKKEDMAKMFNRFERFVRPNEFAGMGLGLYIVRQIIDAHRGKIEVQSEYGKGTSFIVTLPIGILKEEKATTENREGLHVIT